ncbi:MAG: hypothetical protein GWN32_13360, partial [Gemmatimonadetes bacterium]|nr:hypothetical protein [Gemmatimonadota bacterium]
AEAGLPSEVLPALLFVLAAITSFATGTSWGTWAIMLPIALPMVHVIGLNAPLTVAAVWTPSAVGRRSLSLWRPESPWQAPSCRGRGQLLATQRLGVPTPS